MTSPAPISPTSTALGIFGGTFDPIHLGHTSTIAELMALTALEETWFIPAASPPHRDRPGAAPRHRLEMTRLATSNMSGVWVDDRELYRHGPSYTVDTLDAIQRRHPGRSLCLILGLDALLGLEGWYRWREVLRFAGILVMVRPDYAVPLSLPDWWQWQDQGDISTQTPVRTGKIRSVPVTPTPISATEVRARIQRGDSPAELLHPDVWHYIQSHHLYDQ